MSHLQLSWRWNSRVDGAEVTEEENSVDVGLYAGCFLPRLEGKEKIIIVSLEEIGFVVVKWFAEGNFVVPALLTLNGSYHSHVTLKEFFLVKTEVFVDVTINSSMVFRYLARIGSLFVFWRGKTKKNSFKWGKWRRVFNIVQIKYYNVVTTFCRRGFVKIMLLYKNTTAVSDLPRAKSKKWKISGRAEKTGLMTLLLTHSPVWVRPVGQMKIFVDYSPWFFAGNFHLQESCNCFSWSLLFLWISPW